MASTESLHASKATGSGSGSLVVVVLMTACVVGFAPRAMSGSWLYSAAFLFLLQQLFRTYLKPVVLRRLLAWNGWIGGDRNPSLKLKIWSLLVKAFLPRKRSTFVMEESLPSLPLPSLQDTCDRYLDSVRPLLTTEEYLKTSEALDQLQSSSVAKQAQAALVKMASNQRNWLSEWWLEYQYLRSPWPLCVNYNWFVLEGEKCRWNPQQLVSKDVLKKNPYELQTTRAAAMLAAFLNLHEEIVEERLEPGMVGGMIPIDMSGFRLVFGSCRRPHKRDDRDEFVRFEQDLPKRHIVVVCKGHFFSFPVHHQYGERLYVSELKIQFDKCIEMANQAGSVAHPIGAMTAGKRPDWAAFYRTHILGNMTNEESMAILQSSTILISLDDELISDNREMGMQLLCGNPSNRFYDKGVTMIVLPDGRCGLNVEHSFTDATVVGYLWESALNLEKFSYMKPLTDKLLLPHHLKWDWSESARLQMENALVTELQVIANVDLEICPSPYGKGYIKSVRLSPDGFLQMALQLAFYRDQGYIPLTYESASTRRFCLGRTEVIRTASDASKHFVELFEEKAGPCSTEDKIAALKQAISSHVRRSQLAAAGLGVDRHLFGLKIFMQENQQTLPAFYSDKAYQLPWALSTSQTPTRQTSLYQRDQCVVAGGFGPACLDGYGVSYLIIGDETVSFSICSYRISPKTDSARFGKAINQALLDLRSLLCPTK
eukprot:CAMPEP_0177663262 /NCGR_PEP_ID=MMETSP0447-20121125/19813_1 /TAXON_ID=0 /ORGANISM="Stygamoeba regulata, Strain BSH-02190019" /LENGTH=712 /DNA_ID=CAMNT_0019169049 /DNA_START=61 /DNA_END=2196 /DNA_ORIENTATION=-